jgi:hypothetical protein
MWHVDNLTKLNEPLANYSWVYRFERVSFLDSWGASVLRVNSTIFEELKWKITATRAPSHVFRRTFKSHYTFFSLIPKNNTLSNYITFHKYKYIWYLDMILNISVFMKDNMDQREYLFFKNFTNIASSFWEKSTRSFCPQRSRSKLAMAD